MDKKNEIENLYNEFDSLIGGFLYTIDDRSLYIVFERIIAEMNRRKEQRENGEI